jgi:hypothetical protein
MCMQLLVDLCVIASRTFNARYFKHYPIDYPHEQEPMPEMTLGVNDDAPDPEYPVPDPTIMAEDEYKVHGGSIPETTIRQLDIGKRFVPVECVCH